MSKPIAISSISISDAMASPKLFGPHFAGDSWNRWRAVLKATFGEPMNDAEREDFRVVAERLPPTRRVREAIYIAGRGAGKDSVASLIASHIAVTFEPAGRLRPGEVASILCIAVDREQANIVLNYIKAYFETVPALAALVKSIDRDGVTLRNGVAIVVATNSFRSVRGRTIIAAIFDEVAFWRDENSATPDVETAGAVQPGLARLPDSMLILISTVHKRSGLLYEKWKAHYGIADDDVLVIRATTQQLNPTFDAKTIARQIASDPALYNAEYNSQWRDDLSSYISRELLEAAVDRGVVVRPPNPETTYYAFADPSGGAHDSFTAAIAHREKGDVVVLDMLYERRPPFNPSETVQEIATLLQDYGLSKIVGDRYAAQWVVEAFDKCGVRYEQSERDRSQIYLDTLPLFTAGQARLIDNARLIAQFAQLERRTFSSGKDRVDHGRAGHDDLCNSAAGAMILASRRGAYPDNLDWVGDLPASDKTADGQPRFCAPPTSIFQHPIFNGGVRRW
jgi:hypothetical protein